jgi:protocatechuate 3,4-dioxygenase beta subunit
MMSARPNNRALLARRHVLEAALILPVGVGPAQAQGALAATPTQTLGPFYPRNAAERPKETDNDLIADDGRRVLTRGTPIFLTGRVLNRRGDAIAGAAIEIWQCDANAVYHHPAGGAEAERDPHFQGYGVMSTGADGAFHFRTIRPVPYPGRTPHIHVRVAAAGAGSLSTQLYLPDAPGNRNDVIYRRLSESERNAVALRLVPTATDHPLARLTQFTARVDLVFA